MPAPLQRARYIARLIASSFLRRLRFAMGQIESETGSTVSALSVDAAVAYIQRTFAGYEKYGGWNAEATLRALDRVLKPGGWMIHKIDLRDDGLFSGRGFPPREFLTISEPVYWLTAYDTDKTCRRPLSFYRGYLHRLGYQARCIITGIIETEGYKGVENPAGDGKERLEAGAGYGADPQRLVAQIRPRLSRPFRDVNDSDLLAAGAFLVAQKPK